MKHLSFDEICRIADGNIQQSEMELHLAHWKSCPSCQQEVELQRSIVQVSRKTKLFNPSNIFTQGVLDIIIPSQKKRWYEWLLHNMGNISAMASILALLGYIFSVTETGAFKKNDPAKIQPITEFVKIIQKSSQQLGTYLTPKLSVQSSSSLHTNTIFFALLAIVLLVVIDRIASHFFAK
jgi:hypothetical protein